MENKTAEILIGIQIGIGITFLVFYWLGFRGLVLPS